MSYRDRNSMMMFIRNKPIEFGYELWVLAGDDGYPYKFEIYQGAGAINQKSDQPWAAVLSTICCNQYESILQLKIIVFYGYILLRTVC